MRRVLVITYYWPPTGGSGVQRWVKFSKYLPSLGWQPVIYTPENPEQLARDESLLADIPPEAEVLKTHITEPYELARKIMGGGSAKGAGVNPVNGQEKSLAQKAALWVRGNCFVPDPRVWWVRPSVKFLKKYLKEHPVDVMVTTGPPQSMHLIGLELHRQLGIPWIADFRDPWTKIFYFKHLGLGVRAARLHREMEQSVLDGASAVVAVSPLVQEDFQAATRTPVELITNGYDEEDFASGGRCPVAAGHDGAEDGKTGSVTPGSDRGSAAAPFRIVHTGLFASDGNPLELWRILGEMSQKWPKMKHPPVKKEGDVANSPENETSFQIRLAGKVDPEILEAINAAGLAGKVVNLGYLSHEESVRELQSADLLILPLRQEPEYRKVLPGKIFEYLAARKPVLGIGQEDGAAARLLMETGAGIMLDWPKGDAMAEFARKVAEGEFRVAGRGIEQYSRRGTARKMAELFERVSDPSDN